MKDLNLIQINYMELEKLLFLAFLILIKFIFIYQLKKMKDIFILIIIEFHLVVVMKIFL
jgi:hypothetical protein